MDYFLKANGLIILLTVFYYLFLRNETFFVSIRIYFLAGLILILVIPFIEIPIYIEQAVSNINYYAFEGNSTNIAPVEQSFQWTQLLVIIYVAGVFYFSMKFSIQLFSLVKLLTNHKFIQHGYYKLVETDKDISPFSFFNYIIYNKSHFTQDELEQIIKHEKTHVDQWHSIDTLLTYILQIVFWFNPFAWFYKKAAQQNLEFLADASASKQTENQTQYQFTLLKACNANYCEAITNNFYNSLIKKRIVMLQKHRSEKKMQWKFALLLPLLLTFIFAFNTKTIAQKAEKEIQTQTVDVQAQTITKNSTDQDLDIIKEYFDKIGLNVIFKGLKRKNGIITAIKIDAKTKNNSIRAAYSIKVDDAIETIIIGFDRENNTINIGNTKAFAKKIFLSEQNTAVKNKKIRFSNENSSENNEIIEIVEKPYSDNEIIESDEEVIEVVEEAYGDQESNIKNLKIEVIREGDATSKTDTLHVNGLMHIFLTDSDYTNGNPLYIIDGKESTADAFKSLSPQNINSISVIKDNGKLAYGDKGKNGVIMVLTKNSKPLKHAQKLSNSVLYIIDGKESTKEASDNLNPGDIKSMNVLKGEKAIEKYGDKGKNGVIEITLKKE